LLREIGEEHYRTKDVVIDKRQMFPFLALYHSWQSRRSSKREYNETELEI